MLQRFYLPHPEIKNEVMSISDERVLFQATRVLRMKTGERFRIFDGGPSEWAVEILSIDKRALTARVVETMSPKTESPLHVSLFQAIPKKPALFELVVQKATELGVAEIYPLITGRTEQRHGLKTERLKLIAMEASEQCGRTKIPSIHPPITFADALSKMDNGFMAYEGEKENIGIQVRPRHGAALPDHPQSLQLIIGPEGGLSDNEVAAAKKAGIQSFSLGPRILRTETAAIAALSLMLSSPGAV